MTETDVVQIFNFLFATAMIPSWIVVGVTNPRVGWKAVIPAIIGVMASLFYFAVIFTDLSQDYRQVFQFLSALMRLYEYSTLLFGAWLMLYLKSERAKAWSRSIRARYFTRHGASHE